ncbi:hypothetical protein CYMTET_36873 [Cymbomonas tetramitiformis]|uniref:Uncharacterized protein n=1 Tax=Cymbomonas tetramitiformis TaxID=36881 RepID=A0AAE0CGV4_9CHLO|nr:hypothetical protein CYMTET_36873 [Cymbomonas tetramitiformis]
MREFQALQAKMCFLEAVVAKQGKELEDAHEEWTVFVSGPVKPPQPATHVACRQVILDSTDLQRVKTEASLLINQQMSAKDAEDLTLFRSLVSDGIIQKDAGSVLLSSPPAKKRKTQAV